MRLRVIDTETTGIPSATEKHALCEIGWCDVERQPDGEWRVGSPKSGLCNPGRPMPLEAMAVHHLRDCDLIDASSPDAALRLMMADAPEIFVAHNADFERQFVGSDIQWLCTFKAAVRIWPDAPQHGNQFLRYYLGLDEEMERDWTFPPHRAGPDAYVTAHLLVKLIESGTPIEDMLRWSKGPALLPRITFGKHAGKKWEDIDSSYLEWMVKQTDMDRDALANAKHHLKKRSQST